LEKLWRDSKIGAIYEGTSNIQLETIAKLIRELLGLFLTGLTLTYRRKRLCPIKQLLSGEKRAELVVSLIILVGKRTHALHLYIVLPAG